MADVKPCLARLKAEAGSSSRSKVNKSRQGNNQANKAVKVKKEAIASSSRQSSKPKSTSTRAPKVKKETTTSRQSTTTRRVKKERTATDASSSKPATTRRRKTYRRRRRRTVRRTPTTTRSDGARGRGSRSPTNPRARISRTLGINSRNNRAHTLPEVRRLFNSDDDISARRAAAGITGLSLFGDELSDHGAVPPGEEDFRSFNPRSSSYTNNQRLRSNVSTSSGSRAYDNERSSSNIPSSSGLSSRNNIPRRSPSEIKSKISKVDLIGDIMNRQRILLADSRNVTINRDGTLQLNEQSDRRSQNTELRSPSVNNIRSPVLNQQENEPRVTPVPSLASNTTTTALPQSLPEAVREQLISESEVTGIPLEDLIAELREMESLPFSIDMNQPMPALPIKRETQRNHASSSNVHQKHTPSPAKRKKILKSEPEEDIICLD